MSRLLPVGDQQSWDIMDEIFVAYDEAQQISEDYAYEARIDRYVFHHSFQMGHGV